MGGCSAGGVRRSRAESAWPAQRQTVQLNGMPSGDAGILLQVCVDGLTLEQTWLRVESAMAGNKPNLANSVLATLLPR